MAGGIDYIAQSAQVQTAIDQYIRGLQVPPGPPTRHGIYATPEWTGQPYPSIDWEAISQNQEPPEGWPRYPRFNEPGDVPGPPVQFGPPVTNANVKAGHGFIPNGVEEKNLYYYHPDHLGSSSYITDKEGQIIQHTEYIAFGETFVDEHSVNPRQPYLFNGKELDFETGLYYYGARYYDAKTSLWLNVDPLMEKYPEVSPYTYTLNNPIKYIDPDGRDIVIPYGNQSIKLSSVNDIQKLKNIEDNFVQSVYHALNSMKTQEDVVKALHSKNTVKIIKTSMGSEFNDNTLSILWNDTLGLEGLTTGEILSPAGVLVHELNHFNLWDKDGGISLDVYQGTPIDGIGPLSEYEAMEAETKANNGVKVRNSYTDVKLIVTKNAISKEKVRDSDIPQKEYILQQRQQKIEEAIRETIQNNIEN